MLSIVYCSDSTCSRKESCYRYVSDPNFEVDAHKKVRIEATLKYPNEEQCNKFWPIILRNYYNNNDYHHYHHETYSQYCQEIQSHN
jgi:hypothetical protein